MTLIVDYGWVRVANIDDNRDLLTVGVKTLLLVVDKVHYEHSEEGVVNFHFEIEMVCHG